MIRISLWVRRTLGFHRLKVLWIDAKSFCLAKVKSISETRVGSRELGVGPTGAEVE